MGKGPVANKNSYASRITHYAMTGLAGAGTRRGAGIGRGRTSVVLLSRSQSTLQVPWQEAEQILSHEMLAIISPAPELAFQASEAGFPIVLFQPTSIVATQMNKLSEELGNRVRALAGGNVPGAGAAVPGAVRAGQLRAEGVSAAAGGAGGATAAAARAAASRWCRAALHGPPCRCSEPDRFRKGVESVRSVPRPHHLRLGVGRCVPGERAFADAFRAWRQ